VNFYVSALVGVLIKVIVLKLNTVLMFQPNANFYFKNVSFKSLLSWFSLYFTAAIFVILFRWLSF